MREQNDIIDFVKRIVNKRVPIVLGLGGNDTEDIINKMNSINFNSIDAILSVSPYYNKPTQAGILLHYSKIAEASPVDIILYNVPSRTSSNISVNTVVSLAKKYTNIIGIKEASGDIAQCMDLILSCPDDFMIISGDDKMTLPMILLGGSGVISVQAMAFPSLFSDMVQYALRNEVEKANQNHYTLLKSVDTFYVDGNPSGIKQALYSLGICSSNQVRLPLVKMTNANAQLLNTLINATLCNKK